MAGGAGPRCSGRVDIAVPWRVRLLSAVAIPCAVWLAHGGAAPGSAAAADLSASTTSSSSSTGDPDSPFLAGRVTLAADLQSTLEAIQQQGAGMLSEPRGGAASVARRAELRSLFDGVRALHLLVSAEQDDVGRRLNEAGAPAAVRDRHDAMAGSYREEMKALLQEMDAVETASRGSDDAAFARALETLLRRLESPTEDADRTPLGVSLPYRTLDLAQIAPQMGPAIVPAYLNRIPPQPADADIAEGPEVGLTPEILAQARALHQNPIEIFEFVQNQVEMVFYHGAMNGAVETLRQRRGNDVDQASLLIALLRASGIPARYVRGVIELPAAQAVSWTGTTAAPRAADLLARAGIPIRTIRQGGAIASMQVEHTWVEAYLPYSNYRGVPLDSAGRAWIPLDPSITSSQYAPGEDLLTAMDFRADRLIGEYLSGLQTVAPVDFYRGVMTNYLAQYRPDLTLDQIVGRKVLQPFSMGLLPSTLPYATISVNEEGATLPERLRHKVRFIAQGENGVSLDVSLPASQLVGRRVTMSYVPATVEDQAAVAAFISINNTPAYLLKLRPVLKVGGVIRGAGERPVQMGALHTLTMEFQTPHGTTNVTNSLVAGGYYAIGLGAHRAAYVPPSPRAPEDTEHEAADLLYRAAADYLEGWNQAEQIVADILRVAYVRPVLSEVMVGSVYRRTVLFGQPQAMDWRGVFVDADLRVTEPVSLTTNLGAGAEFLRLSGLAGSMLEGDVLEQHFEVDAVSAAKLIQLARQGGIPIDEIDASNIAARLPLLQTADVVKTEIADAVNQGWRVTIPRSDLVRNIYRGIGYTVFDSATGSGGYFISGSLAGGMTSQDPEDFPEIAETLANAYAGEPNANPMAAAYINRVAATDKQEGTVGAQLAQPLAVWVRDSDGRPVQGAYVTFIIHAGGGEFGGALRLTTTTDYLGVAKANPTLGQRTGIFPFYVMANPGDQHPTQVGQNLITASVASANGDVYLDVPFQVFAYPGPPTTIVKVLGEGNFAVRGTAAGTLRARLEDRYQNPISNVDLTFTVQPAVPGNPAIPLPVDYRNMVLHLRSDCAVQSPILGECDGRSPITLATTVFGASVETILGDTVNTRYSVEVRATGTTAAVPPVIFNLSSTGNRASATGYIPPQLLLSFQDLVNDRNQLLNAAQVGQPFARPFEVLVYLLEDEYVVAPVAGQSCGCTSPPCYELQATGRGTIRRINGATVNFAVTQGGGTMSPTVAAGNGTYSATLTVGTQPGINTVLITGSAPVSVPKLIPTTGNVSAVPVTLQVGEEANFWGPTHPSCNGSQFSRFAAESYTREVFGVRATVGEVLLALGGRDQLLADVDVPYLIEPTQPSPYNAQAAEIDILTFDPTNPVDEWAGFVVGNRTSLAGAARLFQGTGFDPSKRYRLQAVLNRGSEVEIKSEKVEAPLVFPAQLEVQNTSVRTYIDRINQQLCAGQAEVVFGLSHAADVTVRVEGEVVQANVRYEAGVHRIPIPLPLVGVTGEHPVEVTAVFRAEAVRVETTKTGTIVHDAIINEFLPVGHTLVKGVDLQDGHVSYMREDLSIPGIGPPLRFTRSYGSTGNNSSGTMGAGWVHNYESRLVRDGCGGLSIIGGEGSGIRFTQGPNGFVPQRGYHASLTHNTATDSYDFYSKERMRYHYVPVPISQQVEDPGVYRLAFIEDPHGNRLTMRYELLPYESQREALTEVVDAAGRKLLFTYAASKDTAAGRVFFGTAPKDRIIKVTGPTVDGQALELVFDYDQYGNLIRAARDSRVESFRYTSDDLPLDRRNLHNLREVADPNGNRTEYVYYQESDTFPGENSTFTWGADILIFPEQYEFVKSVVEGVGSPVEAATNFTYDYSQHQTRLLTTVIDPRNVSTIHTLNPLGNVVEQRVVGANDDGTDSVTTMRWAYEFGIQDVFVKEQTDPNGRVTRYDYDGNANLVREELDLTGLTGYAPVRDAAGNPVTAVVTQYAYDQCTPTFNRVRQMIDPEGRITDYQIDCTNGDVRSITTYPGGGAPPIVMQSSYYGNGLLRSVTDPRGFVTQYETYDTYGNPRRVVDAAGNVTTNIYDARSRLRETTDTFGHRTVYEAYDNLDRLVRVVTYAGTFGTDPTMASSDEVTTYDYYPDGQKRLVTDGLGHTTEFLLDALNRVTLQRESLVDADGQPVTIEIAAGFDGNGNKVYERDGRGIEQEFVYDALNRLRTRRFLPDQQPISLASYDRASNRVTETDVHGHTTSFEYDGLYRVVRTNLALAPYFTTTDYDRVGTVLRTTDANGHATTMGYDGVYRMTSKTDAEGNTVLYRYDASGNKIREEDQRTGLVVRIEPYDALNRPTRMVQQFTDPLTAQLVSYPTVISYLDAQNVREITNPRGVTVREVYSGTDRLVERVVDPTGLNLITRFAYDGNGNQRAMKDPQGNDLDLIATYDGLNRKIKATYLLGGEEKFFYDNNGNVVRQVDKRGIVTRHEYDRLNRQSRSILVESISNAGAELVLAENVYDDAASTTTTFDANRNRTIRTFDALHRETIIEDALGQQLRSAWDGVNKIAQTDKKGFRTEFHYDDINRLVGTVECGAASACTGANTLSSMSVEYVDGQNRRIETDRRGIATVIQSDPLDRVRRILRRHPALATEYGSADIVIQETAYDGNNNQVRLTDANGHVTEFGYDNADRKTSVVDGAGSPVAATTVYTYDGVGNLRTVKDARVHGGAFDQRFTYDARYRKVREENGAGEATLFGYDQNNNLTSITEPKGLAFTTSYAYDETNVLRAVDETRGGAGGVTRYAYDANRNKIAQQDAEGNLTTYAYDALNRLTDVYQHTAAGTVTESTARGADPRGSLLVAGGDLATARHWSYGFDANNNQERIIDARGQQVDFSHDYLNRVVRKDYTNHRPGPTGADVYPNVQSAVFGYDANGNLVRTEETKRFSAVDTVVEITAMDYDHLDRLAAKTNYDGKVVRFTYDRLGIRSTVTDADGVQTTYGFDARNRVETVTTEGQVTSYRYWADGLQRAIVYPNGTVAQTQYDRADRIARIINHTRPDLIDVPDQIPPAARISQYDYQYDLNGNRSEQIETHREIDAQAPETVTYRYDVLNRLTSVSYGGVGAAYTYSRNGNRLTEVGTDSSTGGALNRQYTYDRLNQLVRITDGVDPTASTVMRYDENGNTTARLTGVIDPATGQIPAPTGARYFDFDIRDQMAVADSSVGGRIAFDYDVLGMRVKKISGGGQTRYLYDNRSVLQEYDGSTGATTLKYNYATELLSLVEVGATARTSRYYLLDALMSTSELTDGAGNVQVAYRYDVWGGVRRSAGASVNPRKFTGHYFDTETDLHYMGARYYDDAIGRFMSQDPYPGEITAPPSLHHYMYAYNNPTMFLDLYGYSAQERPEGHVGAWDPDTPYLNQRCKGEISVFCSVRDMSYFVKGLVKPAGTMAYEFLATVYDLEQMAYYTMTGKKDLDQIAYTSSIGQAAVQGQSSTQILGGMAMGIIETPGRVFTGLTSGDPEQMGEAIFEIESALAGFKGKGKAASTLGKLDDASRTTLREAFMDVRELSAAGNARRAAIKDVWKEFYPTLGASTEVEAIIKGFAKEKGYSIGIRAADPSTALGAGMASDLRIPAKNVGLKTKSGNPGPGLLKNPKNGKLYRSDLDLAYVLDAGGNVMDQATVFKEVIKPLNQRLKAAGRKPEFMHGPQLNAMEKSGMPFARNPKPGLTLEGYAKIGHPGPVIEIGPSSVRTMSSWQVREFALSKGMRWSPAWDKALMFSK